jgi:hypothetical protein
MQTFINIPVDDDLATVYEAASTEDRQKIQLFLRLLLHEIADTNPVPLNEIMDSISDNAQARGLIPSDSL